MTGDRRDDVVVLASDIERDNHAVFIYVQQPDRSLSAPVQIAVPDSDPLVDTYLGEALGLALGDFDEDGAEDILITRPKAVQLLRFISDAWIVKGAPNGYPPFDLPAVVVDKDSGDIGADGHLDIAVHSGTGVLFYLGDGHGAFPYADGEDSEFVGGDSEHAISMVSLYSGVARRTDVLYYMDDHEYYQIRYRDYGKFLVNPSLSYMASGDFDGDGLEDLEVSDTNPAPGAQLYFFKGAGPQWPMSSTPVVRPAIYAGATPMEGVDLDLDGYDDLLVGYAGQDRLGYFLQRGGQLQAGVFRTVSAPSASVNSLGVGDINGDGCTDVAFAGGYGGLTLLRGSGCPLRAKADFNGDGRSDILWRNMQDGSDVIWPFRNAKTAQVITSVTDLAWRVVGLGNFNGDDQWDILWRSGTTGANAIWLSGNSATPQSISRISDTAWKAAAVGDFNGDGKSDIFWRNGSTGADTIWISGNAATPRSTAAVTDLAWKIVGVGDFNGDGQADVLWRNSATGANVIWRSGGTRQSITGVTNQAWKVAGVGDFDGDGKDDILWRKTTTGANVIWRSADSSIYQLGVAPQTTDWDVTAVGDYDGDVVSDILWHNRITGDSVIWRRADAATPLTVASVSDLTWKIVP